ncbi:hypothetical protein Pst134EA_015883 [Puccinia striiformis f. sp. tritici]|uniref:hypothetical protein n=1 Tax=Puccinia striiformis f. sp. tritici TaxID=168172 RepID=UPI00200754A3|nr:hypothetical protein Pst134EA_015883 [Puccinia striiformis f. sp. tritici]KAH9463801.1 hypothetical protein Pst134EA_015883 [Puccinia striiformis f. sp. tritici]
MKKSVSAAKYKGVAKKIRPDQPMPQDINPPLERPELLRNPYNTPLTPFPPAFKETNKITEEPLKAINFGPPGWLEEEEMKLLKHVINKIMKALHEDLGHLGIGETYRRIKLRYWWEGSRKSSRSGCNPVNVVRKEAVPYRRKQENHPTKQHYLNK